MKITSYTRISKYLMAPALISLLVGCGSPSTSTNITNEDTIIENATQTSTRTTFNPAIIEEIQKDTRATGTQIFDGENRSTENWIIFDNTPAGAEIKNVNLDGNYVIFLKGAGLENGFALRQVDGSYLNNTDATKIKWESKFYDDFIIYVAVKLDDGCIKYLSYRPRPDTNHDDVLTFKLPDSSETGTWHTFTRDLEVDLHQYLPERSIVSVLDFEVRGTGCIDEVILMANDSINPDEIDDVNTQTDTQTEEPIEDNGNLDLIIEAEYSVNYSASVSVSGAATTINQDQLAAQLAQDLQNNLNLLLPSSVDVSMVETDYATTLATLDRLLAMSEMILSTSSAMATDPNVNALYISAMLRLSDDIDAMANRILLMTETILPLGDDMEIVGLKMVELIGTIQTNILEAEGNFTALLLDLSNAPEVPEADSNAQMEAMMQEFQTQLSTMITLLLQTQALPDGSVTDADMTDFNNQMAALLSMLTQMQGMTTDPTSGITVDINELMTQFQVSMEPMMSVIPQMFAMADKGMDMMDPEKYIPDMMMMAGEMLEFSKYMVDTAADLMRDPNVDHELYVNAMLRLSDDIGLMADRMLVMADKMLVMGDKMQEVALKMLDMMGETQTNLLISQENFNTLLLGLAGRS